MAPNALSAARRLKASYPIEWQRPYYLDLLHVTRLPDRCCPVARSHGSSLRGTSASSRRYACSIAVADDQEGLASGREHLHAGDHQADPAQPQSAARRSFFRRFFDSPELGPRKFQSAGSGVIFDAKNGYIVTNAHVIENASEITVTLQDGQDLKADVVGTDTPSDVAVLE